MLKFPKFEEIIKNKDDRDGRVRTYYIGKICYILEYACNLEEEWKIFVTKYDGVNCECLFEAKPTKENYEKACEIIKDIVKGDILK